MLWGGRAGCQNHYAHSVGGGQCPSRDAWTALQKLQKAQGSLREPKDERTGAPLRPNSPIPPHHLCQLFVSHRRRKQRRGRYRGSCTRSGAARSSLTCRAWWSCWWLSDGAHPRGGESLLSCCTAGTLLTPPSMGSLPRCEPPGCTAPWHGTKKPPPPCPGDGRACSMLVQVHGSQWKF